MKNNLVRALLGVIGLTLCFLISSPHSSASQLNQNNSDRLIYLGVKIAALNNGLHNANAKARAEIAQLAAERFNALQQAAESNPSEVQQASLSDQVLARIPADLQQYFEKREDIEGELEIIEECEKTEGRTLYYLKTVADEHLSLHFTKSPTKNLETGMQVRVRGLKVGDSVVTSEDSLTTINTKTSLKNTQSAGSFSQAALSNTLGEHKVLVILVNFQDKQTQPFTTDQARDVTFNQTSNYYREVSYGQTWLTGDVYGWYTIPINSTNCDTAAIATYAKAAAVNAGANLGAYNHLVYAFPQNTGCGFTGRGSIGGSPGEVWINQYFDINAVGHELGHNYGVFHSRSLDCGSVVVGGTCTTNEYGDVFDIMGGGASAHMNLFQKERLGWVNQGVSPPLQTVTASGNYWIDAYETSGSNSKGLKILKSTDPVSGLKTWYYVEHRTPTGFDGYLSGPNYNVVNGVSVHTGSESSGAENYLLDMTPATSSWYDAAIIMGQTFTDPNTGTSITTLSADSTGAWVQVNLASQPCSHANPSVTVTPGQTPWLISGTTYSYIVSVANGEGSGCSPASFNLQANVPAGWTAVYSSPTLSIAPGGSATTSLSVTSPTGAVDGNYSIGVSAQNGSSQSYTGSSSAAYAIVSALSVTASSGSATYTRTQKATVTAVVSAAGAPVAGGSVTFIMTKPNNEQVTQTVATDTNGKAVFLYSFNKLTDPKGTYQVGYIASFNGLYGKGKTSFLVKR